MNESSTYPALSSLQLPQGASTAADATMAHLDLLLLGLESLSGESSEAVLTAAQTLNVDQWIGDRVGLWRLRNASPLRKSSGGRKKVDIDEARALVLIVCYLARQQQPRIRETLTNLEAAVAAERSPYREPLVSDYLDEYHAHYRSRMVDGDQLTQDQITEQSLRMLIELQFYGSKYGPQRLWTALLSRPEIAFPDMEEAALDANLDAKSETDAVSPPAQLDTGISVTEL